MQVRVKILLHDHDPRDHDPRPFQTGDRLREVIAFDHELDRGVEGLLRGISSVLHGAIHAPCVPSQSWFSSVWRSRSRQDGQFTTRCLTPGDMVIVGETAFRVHDAPCRPRQLSHIVWQPVSLLGTEIVSDGAAWTNAPLTR
jgi:hypothetical protein